MSYTATGTRIFGLLLSTALIASPGCGGSGGDDDDGGVQINSCNTFTACGGNLIGSWDGTGLCFNDSLRAQLEGSVTDGFGMSATACKDYIRSLDVAPDNLAVTFTDTRATVTGGTKMTMGIRLTPDCFASLAMMKGAALDAKTCDAFGAAFSANLKKDPESSFQSVTCALSGANCDCSLTGHQSSADDQTYTIKGTSFVTQDGDSTSYCVSGSTLRAGLTDSTGKVMGLMTFKKR